MFNPLAGIPTIAWLIFAVVVVVLIIGWIILPFIMMNTNAYLRRVLREQERTNALLEAMRPARRVFEGSTKCGHQSRTIKRRRAHPVADPRSRHPRQNAESARHTDRRQG